MITSDARRSGLRRGFPCHDGFFSIMISNQARIQQADALLPTISAKLEGHTSITADSFCCKPAYGIRQPPLCNRPQSLIGWSSLLAARIRTIFLFTVAEDAGRDSAVLQPISACLALIASRSTSGGRSSDSRSVSSSPSGDSIGTSSSVSLIL